MIRIIVCQFVFYMWPFAIISHLQNTFRTYWNTLRAVPEPVAEVTTRCQVAHVIQIAEHKGHGAEFFKAATGASWGKEGIRKL